MAERDCTPPIFEGEMTDLQRELKAAWSQYVTYQSRYERLSAELDEAAKYRDQWDQKFQELEKRLEAAQR